MLLWLMWRGLAAACSAQPLLQRVQLWILCVLGPPGRHPRCLRNKIALLAVVTLYPMFDEIGCTALASKASTAEHLRVMPAAHWAA